MEKNYALLEERVEVPPLGRLRGHKVEIVKKQGALN
jgi:hypothetical protein